MKKTKITSLIEDLCILGGLGLLWWGGNVLYPGAGYLLAGVPMLLLGVLCKIASARYTPEDSETGDT